MDLCWTNRANSSTPGRSAHIHRHHAVRKWCNARRCTHGSRAKTTAVEQPWRRQDVHRRDACLRLTSYDFRPAEPIVASAGIRMVECAGRDLGRFIPRGSQFGSEPLQEKQVAQPVLAPRQLGLAPQPGGTSSKPEFERGLKPV